MHSKKASFDQIFTAVRNIGISEVMTMWESRLFGKTSNIETLMEVITACDESFSQNRSYVVITDIKAMKTLHVSSHFQHITGLPLTDFSTTFFLKHYCQADGVNGLVIHNLINAHQKRSDIADKHLYLYTSNFRFLNVRGYYTWMFNRMMFIEHDENNKPSLLFSIVTDVEPFKKNDNLSYSRMKYNPNTKNYELEHYEEFLPDGLQLLSKTDLNILRLLSNGLDNEQIASELALSEHTIKDYRKAMLKKTWCSNTCELVAFALRNKLI